MNCFQGNGENVADESAKAILARRNVFRKACKLDSLVHRQNILKQ